MKKVRARRLCTPSFTERANAASVRRGAGTSARSSSGSRFVMAVSFVTERDDELLLGVRERHTCVGLAHAERIGDLGEIELRDDVQAHDVALALGQSFDG